MHRHVGGHQGVKVLMKAYKQIKGFALIVGRPIAGLLGVA